MLSIGKKIVQLRGKLKQDALADICGISTATISSYETDKSFPGIDVIIKMCEYFSISIEFFTEDKFPEEVRDLDNYKETALYLSSLPEVIQEHYKKHIYSDYLDSLASERRKKSGILVRQKKRKGVHQ